MLDTTPLLNSFRSYTEFSDEDFARFLEFCVPFRLKKNDFFYKAGEVPKYSPFILKGCARQFRINENGDEQIILFVEEGTWAGQIGSMRSKVPTDIYLQATEDCELLGVTIADADHLMEAMPAYQKYFSKKYPVDHAQLMNDALRIKTDTPENLYSWLLKTRPSLIQRVPQHLIANYLGLRTETISRIRKKLAGK